MADGGYRGVSAEQDGRFRNKERSMLRKLASEGQFPPQFDEKVDMQRVSMDVMKPWIGERVEELLGFEDDVVVEYVNGMLDDKDNRHPDPRKMQLSLTGFLESNTATFMAELWTLLLSAQRSIGGIPKEFVEKKKEEMRKAREEDAAAIAGSALWRNGGSSVAARGADGRPTGRSRWDEGHHRSQNHHTRRQDARTHGPRREFVDRAGNRTERVQDQGWRKRQRSRSRSPPPYERRYGERRQDERREEANPYSGDGDRRRGHNDSQHGSSSRKYRRSPGYSPSRSPSPRRYRPRDDGSVTPDWRPSNRRRSPLPSLTPSPRRRADRSPTYSPEPARVYDDEKRQRSGLAQTRWSQNDD